jgi:glyoxylase-like metal-dependent hydrolase (beta-lactamase superfamily II)
MEQGDTFAALGLQVEVRHVPGHCPGNILFYLPVAKLALVGDALFNGSIGRTDLPGGSMEILADSIRRQIYTLPEETIVYPGHGPETTVGEEKTNNPYVRA